MWYICVLCECVSVCIVCLRLWCVCNVRVFCMCVFDVYV